MSLGNLAVLGIMLVILAVYRRMDMNNRTLEKEIGRASCRERV